MQINCIFNELVQIFWSLLQSELFLFQFTQV